MKIFKLFKTIAKAWITAANPSAEEKEIAEHRLLKCNSCKYRKKSWIIFGMYYCSQCGCPLEKKIFAEDKEECPKNYWLI